MNYLLVIFWFLTAAALPVSWYDSSKFASATRSVYDATIEVIFATRDLKIYNC